MAQLKRPSLGQASAIAGILGSLAAVVAVVVVESESWIEWTRDDLRIHAFASRNDIIGRRALFTAWNSAGPVGPVTDAAGASTSE